jgi:hypothetical protein
MNPGAQLAIDRSEAWLEHHRPQVDVDHTRAGGDPLVTLRDDECGDVRVPQHEQELQAPQRTYCSVPAGAATSVGAGTDGSTRVAASSASDVARLLIVGCA